MHLPHPSQTFKSGNFVSLTILQTPYSIGEFSPFCISLEKLCVLISFLHPNSTTFQSPNNLFVF
jgi:hypothetical protein